MASQPLTAFGELRSDSSDCQAKPVPMAASRVNDTLTAVQGLKSIVATRLQLHSFVVCFNITTGIDSLPLVFLCRFQIPVAH